MKNMMKKIAAIALIAVMMMSLNVWNVFAEDEQVYVDCCNEEICFGDLVTLVASVVGVEGEYRIVWERCEGGCWEKVGAGMSYQFVVDEMSAACDYRALVIVAE